MNAQSTGSMDVLAGVQGVVAFGRSSVRLVMVRPGIQEAEMAWAREA